MGAYYLGEVNALTWVTGTAEAAPSTLATAAASEQIVRAMPVAAAAAAVVAAVQAVSFAFGADDVAAAAAAAAFAPAASAFEYRVPSEQLPPLHRRLPALLPPSSSALRPPAPWVTAACAWSD